MTTGKIEMRPVMKTKLSMVLLMFFIGIMANAEDFDTMRTTLKDNELTEIQRNKIIKSYIGQKVIWQGWIYDVKQSGNKYSCTVSMDKPDAFAYYPDYTFPVNEELAFNLKKGQVVWVTGTINKVSVGLMFTVKLDEMKLYLTNPNPKKK